MSTNAYQNYIEAEILTADPLKLVVLLYRGAIDAVGCARQHLAAGDIRSRSRSINQSVEILAELARSLDYDRGGELSQELARLYDFVFSLLGEANTKQIDPPLASAEKILAILLEGWEGCQVAQESAPQRSSRPASGNWTPTFQSDEANYERLSYAG